MLDVELAARGTRLPALTTGHLASPSPNGRWLAIGRGDHLWVRDMHTGDEVTHGGPHYEMADVRVHPPPARPGTGV